MYKRAAQAEEIIVSANHVRGVGRALFGVLLFAGMASAQAQVNPTDLRCEYKTDPLAIEATAPRLFWKVTSANRGKRQAAYQILVSGSREQLSRDAGDLWDSGTVKSTSTIQVPYGGKALSSGKQVFWKVRVWDEAGTASKWSNPATWTMGLLKPADWTAKWIGYTSATATNLTTLTGAQWLWHAADGESPGAGKRWFRGTLNLPADVAITSAKLLISADDNYDFTVNGGAEHAGPRRTDSWRNFQTFDVAKELRVGPNAIVITAENTTASPAGVIAKLIVTTSAGVLTLTTDGKWETATSATGPFTATRIVGDLGVSPWGQIFAEGGADRTPPPYFRKAFSVGKPLKRAVLYAAALGVYDLSLNGQKVNDDVLSPGWTDFRKRAHYLAYDVTKAVKPGGNALGAILGDGWYASYLAFTGRHHYYGGEPKLRLQLALEYADGTQETVGTDASWKTSYGPILGADLLMGTTIDTQKEMPGWNTTTFDDNKWKLAAVQPDPELIIAAQSNQPIRTTQSLTAKNRTEPTKGVYLYDIGQNMVGWARIKVNGKPGQKITLRHGERLNPDGTLYTTNLRSARAMDTFILKGGPQTLEPTFTFHGFQYVEITGVDAAPSPKDVVAVAVNSDMASTIAFDTDNQLLNRLVQNIDWGYRGNALDVPTDCPQRDERAGWTGDAQVFAKTAMFHRDAAPFYTKWIVDVEDGQFPDGSYPDVAPSILGGGNAAWEDAGVICVYRMYEMYGDTEIIRRHWASLTRFMEHLAKVAPDGVRSAGAYGDWLLLDGPQQSAIHGTAYYFRSASLMELMAKAIGKNDEAAEYGKLTERIRNVFQEKFIGQDGRVTDGGKESQTFYALALEWELLPEAKRATAATRLLEMLKARGGHLTTGFIGTPVLLNALARSGYADEANRLLLNETYPSWLYQVKLGATTMWERWDGWTPEKGFQDAGMNSFNHYWLGCVGEWMYTGVAGIDTAEPGWEKIILRPNPTGTLKRAHCSYDSIRGKIESSWIKRMPAAGDWNGSLQWDIVVPANVTATVYVPAKDAQWVKEGGKPAKSVPGITFVRQENGAAIFTLGSGKYRFTVDAP